jgi:hypothetical protein
VAYDGKCDHLKTHEGDCERALGRRKRLEILSERWRRR